MILPRKRITSPHNPNVLFIALGLSMADHHCHFWDNPVAFSQKTSAENYQIKTNKTHHQTQNQSKPKQPTKTFALLAMSCQKQDILSSKGEFSFP